MEKIIMIRKLKRYTLFMLTSAMLSLAVATQAGESSNKEFQPKPIPKILLDTDPGGDDAFALLLLQSLAKQGVVDIVGVTTVEGNVSSKLTFDNASKILMLGGFAQQVDVGKAVPIQKRRCKGAPHIHGNDGLGNLSYTLPDPIHNFDKVPSADDMIIDKLNATPGEIILVAIGPLTNLAAAEAKSPGILAKAKEVVIMGGTFHDRGNIASHAEFNIYCNPEAAQQVFASRDDIVVLPLDVTHQIIFTKEHANAILEAAPQSDIAKFINALTEFMVKTTVSFRGTKGVNGFFVHDASTLAYLFYPETLQFRRAEVRVETKGEFTSGQTLIDDRHSAKKWANAWVALDIDEANFLAILIEDMKALIK
jgi:inosine-uridine nucleoside N-ribohydrolase